MTPRFPRPASLFRSMGFPALALLVAVLAGTALPGALRAADPPAWTLDAANSSITFTGRQMGAPSTGKFTKLSATIAFDKDSLSASRVEVVIDTTSAETGNTDIDTVLKGPKWLATGSHPKATFTASSFTDKGDGQYEAKGTLTIRGSAKDVTVPFKLAIQEDMATATGAFTIKRLAYGIGTGEWGDTGIVADEVEIKFTLKAKRGN